VISTHFPPPVITEHRSPGGYDPHFVLQLSPTRRAKMARQGGIGWVIYEGGRSKVMRATPSSARVDGLKLKPLQMLFNVQAQSSSGGDR
jgi:hypothetical protein